MTEEISNQRVKPYVGGRNLCREGVSGGREHDSKWKDSEMVESVLLDAYSTAVAALPEI